MQFALEFYSKIRLTYFKISLFMSGSGYFHIFCEAYVFRYENHVSVAIEISLQHEAKLEFYSLNADFSSHDKRRR